MLFLSAFLGFKGLNRSSLFPKQCFYAGCSVSHIHCSLCWRSSGNIFSFELKSDEQAIQVILNAYLWIAFSKRLRAAW
jgi:hypothetical protein